MAKIVLKGCKVRATRFVPLKGEEPKEFDLEQMVEKFAPQRTQVDRARIRSLQSGSFIGIVKSGRTGEPVPFFLMNQDRSADFGWLLKNDPTFESRVVEVYRVESVQWDSSFEEFTTREAVA